ncbi:MAG: DUF4239 domain-containing protein [Thermoanaerobaculia bacterium]
MIIVVALSVVVPWLAVRLVRRIWPYPAFKENNELVGFTFAVYGLIYGVLLAFTIIVGWERFAGTEQLVMHEATILSELWRDVQAFPPAVRDGVHNDLIAYARSVIDDEWPAMAARGQAHPQTRDVYEHLWTLTYQIQPETKNQEAYLTELLARMNELSSARRLRILRSRMEVHSLLWLVLLIGAVPNVAYTLLLSNKHTWVQVAIMGSIMLIVLLGLLVTLSLQHPFTGDVSVQPEAFRELLDSFHQRLAQTPP